MVGNNALNIVGKKFKVPIESFPLNTKSTINIKLTKKNSNTWKKHMNYWVSLVSQQIASTIVASIIITSSPTPFYTANDIDYPNSFPLPPLSTKEMNKELPTKRKGLEKLLLSLLITKIFLRHKYKNTIAYFASISEVNI